MEEVKGRYATCADPEGDRGPDPPPWKIQVTWVSIEISIWIPPGKSWTPWKMLDPPLDPWKSIVSSVIHVKPLDPFYN